MRKCHYECLYFSSYSSKAVHFHPAHMILQSVHRVIEIIWYIYPYLPPKSSKFVFPGIQILISQYFPPSRKLPTLQETSNLKKIMLTSNTSVSGTGIGEDDFLAGKFFRSPSSSPVSLTVKSSVGSINTYESSLDARLEMEHKGKFNTVTIE